jgi:acyl carrier protein
MQNEQIFTTIQKALKTESQINGSSSMDNIEEWDSLGQLNILVSLNKLFEGKISEIEELGEANSVEKIMMVLKNNEIH